MSVRSAVHCVVRRHARPARHSRGRGFTLLELLVAIAVFAVVAGLAWRGLELMARSSLQLQEAGARLGAVQRALDLMVRDLRQASPRGVRDADGAVLPALLGDARSVELTRAGHGNALAQPRAELERVRWQRDDEVLTRWRWPVLDRGDGSAPQDDPLLAATTGLELRYFTRDGRSHDRWPPARGDWPPLPVAVEVRLVLDDQGELRRLVELVGTQP